jgi:hypothetical protein
VTIVFFQDEDGRAPFLDWFDRLPTQAKVQCRARLQLLADQGHMLRRPAADYLRDGIHELRAKANRVQYRMPALYLSLGGQAIEPIQKRCASILILKKDDRHRWCPNLRSLANLLNYNNIALRLSRPHRHSRLAFPR